jgi:uncharacterized protein (TIGR02757 family)
VSALYGRQAHHALLSIVPGVRSPKSVVRSPKSVARLPKSDALRASLDRLYHGFNHAQSATDPIELVRSYVSRDDREIAGFIASALAFGNVRAVMASIRDVLGRMGASPAAFVRSFTPESPAFDGFVHRWTRARDVAALVWVLRQMLDRSGSIEGFFFEGDDPASPDVAVGLESFSRRALALDVTPFYGRNRPPATGVRYFFSRPSSGGACKRLNLFLRWMVRRDAVDLAVWTGVAASRLVVPLDTHVIRLGQCLGLTRYRSPGWRMASDITARLREMDPQDPVRFDFSICHVGMMGNCGFGEKKRDRDCPFRGACRPGALTQSAARKPPASLRPSSRR